MRWPTSFIAVDWGTTNRRAYLLGKPGEPTQSFADSRGAVAVGRDGFPAAVQEIRDRLGNLPVLLSGMAGSTRGWVDAPYLPIPAGIADLAANLVWVESEFSAIVPGLRCETDERVDVMRGEEVQILGAIESGRIPARCAVCHPGTHNKWVRVEDGRIREFKTIMTGELFALLQKDGLLSDHLQDGAGAGEAFRSGVRRGLAADVLTAELFSVRASVLLGRLRPEDSADFASGLLIGADIASGLHLADDLPLFVMGSPGLTRLYAIALEEAGRPASEIDGEECFIAGARAIVEMDE